MSYKIRYLPLAAEDLDRMAEYLGRFYPQTAGNMLRDIEKKLEGLAQMPEMYEEYPENPFYRRMVIGKYLVFYHVDQENSRVNIYRVIRGTWDIEKEISEHSGR